VDLYMFMTKNLPGYAKKERTNEENSYLLPWYVTVDTGATTTAVPVQNTSSAPIRSSMETRRSSTCSARLPEDHAMYYYCNTSELTGQATQKY